MVEQTYIEIMETLYNSIQSDSCMPNKDKEEALETLASLMDLLWKYSG